MLAFYSVLGFLAEVTYINGALTFVDPKHCGDPPCLLFFVRGHLALVVLPCPERLRAYLVPPWFMRTLFAMEVVAEKVAVGVVRDDNIADLPHLSAWALKILLWENTEVEEKLEALLGKVKRRA